MEHFDVYNLFALLFSRHGGYSLPVFVKLTHPDMESWYFTSNSFDVIFDGQIYKAVTMSYKYPTSNNGVPQGSSLEIDIDIQDEKGNELLKWFDLVDDNASIEITGLINEQGELKPVNHLSQKHGDVSWDGEKIIWNLGTEDRLDMQVNPYVLDEDSLMG